VVDDELDHDLDVAGMGLVEELLEVVEGAVLGVDGGVVCDVVAVVAERRGEEGEEPEAGDSEFLEVVELGDEALKVADAVGVGVGEGANVDLVDNRVFVPEGVSGASGLLRSQSRISKSSIGCALWRSGGRPSFGGWGWRSVPEAIPVDGRLALGIAGPL
jgi:hypothetical protein